MEDVRVLGLDPGETTGYAIMDGHKMVASGQLDTKTLEKGCARISALMDAHHICFVACEDYRVYGWESETHKWSALHTAKLVGAIQCLCWYNNAHMTTRMAVQAKKFVTDDKLVAWGLWKKGERHARDAIRHAVYHQIFGPED